MHVYLDDCFQHVLECEQSSAEARPYGNMVEAFCTSSHLLLSTAYIAVGRKEKGKRVVGGYTEQVKNSKCFSEACCV